MIYKYFSRSVRKNILLHAHSDNKSLHNNIAQTWNSLTMEIKSISNKHHFKKTVQKLFYQISSLFYLYFYLFITFLVIFIISVSFFTLVSEFYNVTSISAPLDALPKWTFVCCRDPSQRQLCHTSCDGGIYQLITFYTFLCLLYICVVVKIHQLLSLLLIFARVLKREISAIINSLVKN